MKKEKPHSTYNIQLKTGEPSRKELVAALDVIQYISSTMVCGEPQYDFATRFYKRHDIKKEEYLCLLAEIYAMVMTYRRSLSALGLDTEETQQVFENRKNAADPRRILEEIKNDH